VRLRRNQNVRGRKEVTKASRGCEPAGGVQFSVFDAKKPENRKPETITLLAFPPHCKRSESCCRNRNFFTAKSAKHAKFQSSWNFFAFFASLR
jgi:hypothetical protein